MVNSKNHYWIQKLVIFDNSEVLNSHWENPWKEAKKEVDLLGRVPQFKLRFLNLFFFCCTKEHIFIFWFIYCSRETSMLYVQNSNFEKLEVKISDCCQKISGEYKTYFCSYLLWVKILWIMTKRISFLSS